MSFEARRIRAHARATAERGRIEAARPLRERMIRIGRELQARAVQGQQEVTKDDQGEPKLLADLGREVPRVFHGVGLGLLAGSDHEHAEASDDLDDGVRFVSQVHGRTVAVQLPDEEDRESYTWIDKLCDDLLDVVIDKAPRWFLIGCAVLVALGLPFWISESLS